MSFLDRIQQCNTYDLSRCIPFIINDEQLGWAEKSFVEHLKRYPEVFDVSEQHLTFSKGLTTSESITAALRPIMQTLHHEGIVDTWVNEDYPIVNAFDEHPRCLIERACTHYFGVRSFGVHINGLVEKAGQIYVWIGKRSSDKPFWPGMLDQLVAGGQPFGISLMDNVIKECEEEANIPPELAKQAIYQSEIHYCSQGTRGMNPDTLFNYDLLLPEDFIPMNTDGEVESFELWDLEKLYDVTENTNDFKDNCNLVNIDLLIRQGFIDDSHAEYQAITNALYASSFDFK